MYPIRLGRQDVDVAFVALLGYIVTVAVKRRKTGEESVAVKRRKTDEERRTLYLRVRLTAEQDVLIKEAAALAGITVSSWAVERLLRAAKAEKKAEQS